MRMNFLNAGAEDSAYIVSRHPQRSKHVQISEFIFLSLAGEKPGIGPCTAIYGEKERAASATFRILGFQVQKQRRRWKNVI
ncbi:hypothetical protein EUGRSUZ_L01521 [Eucalyptus grandis]|uniref:Uncharacterized protein n=1 Tax=Eucalyptus grandis TaxID=71139 RepID=A0A058ZU00_EUCGR|nr:hypothetical protein EUGRSUZ_L01521 [Eucalyptus grandis]